MKTYEEVKNKILRDQLVDRQALIDVEEIYEKAFEAGEMYERFESGDAWIDYIQGWHMVTLVLEAGEGKHPIREALILIDECLGDLIEVFFPSRLEDDLWWEFKISPDDNARLRLKVRMKKGGGCRQVGTGKYEEVMEWRCD